MPLNPMTGQFEYGGESYNMPTMGAGMAAAGMETVGADIPLAFRLMENMPGITAMALFNARRFANTMQKGGYRDVLDPDAKVSRGKMRRAKRVGAFLPDGSGGVAQTTDAKRFMFGSRRDLTGKTPFLKSSLATNNPFRLRNLFRNPTLAHLSGMASGGQYTPYQGMSMMDRALKNRPFMKQARTNMAGLGVTDDTPMLSGGVLGRLSTMGRAYKAELMDLKGARMQARKPLFRKATMGGIRGRRMQAKAAKITSGIDRSLDLLGQSARGPLMPGRVVPYDKSMNTRIAMTSGGRFTSGFLEDVGTILDSDLMKKGAAPKARNPLSQQRYRDMFEKVLGGPGSEVTKAMTDLDTRTVRNLAGKAFQAGERKIGFQLAGRYSAAQFVKASGPLNIIGTAAVVYDLGKMAATAVVGAGNFAKEAVKSMQGSMRKPLFGMGYQDNEVAATSRSRGVMAIQNSRLNARSMLGSEAGMMAAHFG
jgi:hypothetical protein